MTAKNAIVRIWRCVVAVLLFSFVVADALSTVLVRPGDIVVGSDGNLWFPEVGTNRVGRITTGGLVQEFAISGASALGQAIAAGLAEKVCVLGFGVDARGHVWTIDTSGASALFGEFPLHIPFLPTGIVVGPDRGVWISSYGFVYRLSEGGHLDQFLIPGIGDVSANSIAVGPEGNLWFVGSIGPFARRREGVFRMSVGGVIEQVLNEVRDAVSSPDSIITGPDGNLWFTDSGFGEVVRVTTNPVLRTAFPSVGASHVASGPDGNIWVTVPARRAIARLSLAGVSTEFELPTPQSIPVGIVPGPDGNLWFAEPDNGVVGRITPDGLVTEFAVGLTKPVPIAAPRSPRVVRTR